MCLQGAQWGNYRGNDRQGFEIPASLRRGKYDLRTDFPTTWRRLRKLPIRRKAN